MDLTTNLLWKPLLEAAAQTIVGAIGGYAFTKPLQKMTARNSFDGAMGFWKRGVGCGSVEEGDDIIFDGLLPPYTQLFPNDPMLNAARFNQLYSFQGKIRATFERLRQSQERSMRHWCLSFE